jgi:hypothetical protein
MALIHVFTDYTPADEETRQRMAIAQLTWKKQPWRECPVRDDQLPRLWKEEGRQFAYIKDVFDFGAANAHNEDIVCYTNADICVRSDCAVMIAARMQYVDACYSYRRDFPALVAPLHDSLISQGQHYPGSDLKAFRKRWWLEHRAQMADMILGLEAWDPLIRILIEDTHNGRDVELPLTHYHVRHGSFWETPSNRYRLKGQLHCLRLAKAWLLKRHRDPANYGIRGV